MAQADHSCELNMRIKPWPVEDLESVKQCPVCRSAERIILYRGLTDGVYQIADGEWNMYRCTACESGYLDPRPAPSSISRAYSGYSAHSAQYHPIVRRKGYLRALLHDLINGYQNLRFGLKRTPANSFGRLLVPIIPSLRSASDAECRHLPKLPDGGGRLLDVGCGNGAFLALAMQAGWEAEGIDFDPVAIETARSRGLNARCIGVEELVGELSVYDVITLCHVIEHVHEPVELLERLYSLLKPGGVLWVETPNLDSLGAKRYKEYWRGLEPPRHLVMFSSKSLFGALRNVGFKDIHQHWRGMTVFTLFAASDALQKGIGIRNATRNGRPPLSDCVAEIYEMVVPATREFVTFTARK
jgi:2-polyprenyl-3-methyl-5-hydroxy-6-metoxy-1,4-benzoquinol methylase